MLLCQTLKKKKLSSRDSRAKCELLQNSVECLSLKIKRIFHQSLEHVACRSDDGRRIKYFKVEEQLANRILVTSIKVHRPHRDHYPTFRPTEFSNRVAQPVAITGVDRFTFLSSCVEFNAAYYLLVKHFTANCRHVRIGCRRQV